MEIGMVGMVELWRWDKDVGTRPLIDHPVTNKIHICVGGGNKKYVVERCRKKIVSRVL